MEEGDKLDLRRFKRHEKKIPWSLIRKIVIALVMILLTIYLGKVIKNKENKTNEIELELN